ncbi:MAG: hypothetical protein AMDU1_APLC00017G0001, partial [Thermoplasmatales archaeon A-plasma]
MKLFITSVELATSNFNSTYDLQGISN